MLYLLVSLFASIALLGLSRYYFHRAKKAEADLADFEKTPLPTALRILKREPKKRRLDFLHHVSVYALVAGLATSICFLVTVWQLTHQG